MPACPAYSVLDDQLGVQRADVSAGSLAVENNLADELACRGGIVDAPATVAGRHQEARDPGLPDQGSAGTADVDGGEVACAAAGDDAVTELVGYAAHRIDDVLALFFGDLDVVGGRGEGDVVVAGAADVDFVVGPRVDLGAHDLGAFHVAFLVCEIVVDLLLGNGDFSEETICGDWFRGPDCDAMSSQCGDGGGGE